MRIFFTVLSLLFLSACGAFVPNLTSSGDDALFVENVHYSIRCELIATIHDANIQAAAIERLTNAKIDFFEKWGVKYTLTLGVVEDTSLTPSLNILSPATPASLLNPGDVVFTLNTGLGLSAKATRTETDQSFNTVKFLGNKKPCGKETPNNGIVVFGNNLGIHAWLTTRLNLVREGYISSLTNKEAFTYQVTFEIGKRGNLDPKWAFIQRSLKDTGGLFNTGRRTTHTILVTFGPVTGDRQQLAPEAAAAHNALLIGNSIGAR